MMKVYEADFDLISSRTKEKVQSPDSKNRDMILCNHCKRTAANGIRCLGMCVADSDY